MIRVVLTACGLGMVGVAARALVRSRSWLDLLFVVSIAVGGVTWLVWSVPNSLILDHLTHIPGLGALVKYSAATGGLVLLAIWVRTLSTVWRWWHRAAVLVYAALFIALVAAWVALRHAAGSAFAHLLYDGYYGAPLPALVWNLTIGTAYVYACILTGLMIARVPAGVQDRPATLMTRVLVAILLGVGVTCGLLILGQTVASRLGFGAGTVLPIMDLLNACALLIGLAMNSIHLDLWPRWRTAQRHVALARDVRRFRRVREDTTRLLILLSDRLVALLDHTDPVVVAAVDGHGRRCRLSPHERRVALEAARWIVLRRAIISRQPWSAVDETERTEVDRMIVMDAARRAQRDTYFLADVFQVVILVLGPAYVPTWLALPSGPHAWHRVVARSVARGIGGDTRAHDCGDQSSADATAPPRPRAGTRTGDGRCLCLTRPIIAAWRAARWRCSAARAARDLFRIHTDLIALDMLRIDLLVYLRDQADPRLVAAVDTLCRERGIPAARRRAALEAARWVTFFWPSARRAPWEEISAYLAPQDEEQAAAGAMPSPLGEILLYASVCRIVLLVLRPTRLLPDLGARRERRGWHREVAALIGLALQGGTATTQTLSPLDPAPSARH